MSTTPTHPALTPVQHAILAKAIHASEGRIDWFPEHIKGGARKKVLQGLFKRALITPLGDDWFVAAEGYDAMGMPRPAAATVARLDAIIANAQAAQQDAVMDGDADARPRRTRENSKQAEVIRMLQSPEGATIAQICELTGWQAHTVRGAFAGVFRKKLGLSIVSEKPQGGERVYRIA